ncbi:uncharacterized protein LOC131669501 [Phymastichus coffea]|uniref:uncharacterized protein LOC131669501 n=1 Tax=Phymastichus coffea TaxID=108790 RepID=UPI00273C6157|nr:uncharacterized protein LOC131669501 [Phymastichus coffea]XP_058800395.1 uncharacterized protein LOC131669501 [Phymastichus coffea]XP_058800396.1 uncharacterized protein LOC131669501 [Phymastichus coffea]
MRLEARAAASRRGATGPAAAAAAAAAAATATSSKTKRRDWRDGGANSLRRSVTALDGGSRTPAAAHSTAFRRSSSSSLSRKSPPWPLPPPPPRRYRLVLYLLATLLLLQAQPARHLALAAKAAEGSDGQAPRKRQAPPPPRHPYNEYTWELNQLNPWLSACDLAGPAPTDLQGSCQGPHDQPRVCPGECRRPRKQQRSFGPAEFDEVIEAWARVDRLARGDGGPAPKQCLFYLEDAHKAAVCREDFGLAGNRAYASPPENRFWFLSGIRLKHCCEHAVVNALSPGRGGTLEAVLAGGDACARVLDTILQVDLLAARLQCEFEEVLVRYDCGQTYSVIHNCTHCKEAYRKWVCSSLVPYFAHGGPHDSEPTEESWVGRRIRPCRSLCQSVEQRCPYLLPGDRAPAYPTQYAGEPTFLCRDPNIPETGEQAARALHPTSEDECCFSSCNEQEPLLGNCANCSNSVVYMGPNPRDPPTAPQCDVSPALPGPPPRRSPFCGISGIGSIQPSPELPDVEPSPASTTSSTTTTAISTTLLSSSSSSSSSTSHSTSPSSSAASSSAAAAAAVAAAAAAAAAPASPLPLVCLFWLWGVLFSSQCSSLLAALCRRLHCLMSLVLLHDRANPPAAPAPMRVRKLIVGAPIQARPNRPPRWRCWCWRHCWRRHWRWLWPCRWKKRRQPRVQHCTRSASWSREPS